MTTGVRQGCIPSPLLFAIAIDWVMHKVMERSHAGIDWADETKLAELDFADDIVLWISPGVISNLSGIRPSYPT